MASIFSSSQQQQQHSGGGGGDGGGDSGGGSSGSTAAARVGGGDVDDGCCGDDDGSSSSGGGHDSLRTLVVGARARLTILGGGVRPAPPMMPSSHAARARHEARREARVPTWEGLTSSLLRSTQASGSITLATCRCTS